LAKLQTFAPFARLRQTIMLAVAVRELHQIVEAFESVCGGENVAALATVAAVEGSGYRRAGARMLVAADGRVWGSISGGCLDKDVARRARIVIDTGLPDLCCYETANDSGEDFADPGASLGCGGRIDLLIEPVSRQSPGVLMALANLLRMRRPISVATVIRIEPAQSPGPVQRLNQMDGREPEGEIGDSALRAAIVQDLAEPTSGARLVRHRTFAGEWADVLIERISPPQSMVIFGDGRDAEPLAGMAHLLGWHVTAVVRRQPSFRADAICFATDDDPLGGLAPLGPETAVVVMDHDFRRDSAVLGKLKDHPPKYIGILGPRHRTRRLLAAAEIDPTLRQFARRLFWPIGLDLGAQTPEQIALAIVAEIQAVFAERSGGHLRDRGGPIHDFDRSRREISRL
jgi:xanthine/CO dehydrogenase XdhC/CoxF family maturation factor